MIKSAELSVCRIYRYRLERSWGKRFSPRWCGFVMLNPSTADESQDDRTIRRCIGYAQSSEFDGLVVGNLFAYRATDPGELYKADDPVGPDNDRYLQKINAMCAGFVVAGWGTHGNKWPARVALMHDIFPELRCLALTKDGQPRHPLYLRKDLVPEPFLEATEADE